ncbi:Uncharacterized protein DAT39_015948, partial [Clarias magur]
MRPGACHRARLTHGLFGDASHRCARDSRLHYSTGIRFFRFDELSADKLEDKSMLHSGWRFLGETLLLHQKLWRCNCR